MATQVRAKGAKRIVDTVKAHPALQVLLLSIALNLVVESLCRRNFLGGLIALKNPVLFLLGCAILMLTLSPALFFHRRGFVLGVVSILWFGLAVGNWIVTGYRNSPISAIDFAILPSTIGIVTVYFKTWQIILIGGAILLALAGLVVLFFKAKRHKPVRSAAAYTMLAAIGVVFALMTLVRATGLVSRTFTSLAEACRDYGYVYCFSCSVLDRGIARPESYSSERMGEIAEKLEEHPKAPEAPVQPNIIFVQLESLFDATRVAGLEFSEDPLPNLHAMREAFPSGFLRVPSVGAGTANTEFEILTGMSLDYFGPGEYPYETVLRDKTCESVAYNLKAVGYGTHAIHNNTATFYGRNQVFPHLGFDSFTSLEYMQYPKYNPIQWCDDSVLSAQILDALISTEERDLVYAISVQGHGKYPRYEVDYTHHVEVAGIPEKDQFSFSYYVNQAWEMDQFVAELTKALTIYSEPTILVLYGDHLPNFEFVYDVLTEGDCFQTEYVIWANFPLAAEDRDLDAYELSSYVLSLAGVHEGLLTKLHQNRQRYDEADYQQQLELLEYDMLYGSGAIYDRWAPYEPTQMRMGVRDIVITDAVQHGASVAVMGENFTDWSHVWINGRKLETRVLPGYMLLAEDATLESGAILVVSQEDPNGTTLSVCPVYVVE